MNLLPHSSDLGINAVELLSLAEFSGYFGWGYGDSHYFTVESSAGNRDPYKHFVRECHRRGIVVIQDVCYNHYDSNALRAEWQYGSVNPYGKYDFEVSESLRGAKLRPLRPGRPPA